jgi:hypothetical protein
VNADEFVKIVRNGSEKLRVDEIVINTGSQELHGKGMLRIEAIPIGSATIPAGTEAIPAGKTLLPTWWKSI